MSFRHLRLGGIAAGEDRASDRGPGEAGRILGQAGTDPAGAGTGHVVAGRSPDPAGHMGVLGHIEAGRNRAGPVSWIR